MFAFLNRIFNRTTPSDLEPIRAAWGKAAGVTVNEDTAMKVAAFYRGLIYLSTQIAKLPWETKDAEYNTIEDGVAKMLALTPNPYMNSFTFRLWAMQSAVQHGNAYAEIQRNLQGRPIAMWPLPSRKVDVKILEDGKVVYVARGLSAGNKGADVVLQPEDVFHIRNFHTKDGLVGQGVVAFGRDVLGINLAANKLSGDIFKNGGVPSGVLSHPGKISKEAAIRLKEQFSENHSIADGKAGGLLLLEEGTKFEKTSLDPEALQMIESKKFGVLEIARFLGVPPIKLFDIQTATFSNQEQSNLEVANDILDAWAVNFEMETNVKILSNSHGGRYAEMDLYCINRGDMKTRADFFTKLMQNGAITPNQIRAKEGMAGYPQGNKYYIAVNNYTPVDRMDEVIDSQIASKKNPATQAEPSKPATPDAGTKALQNAAIQYLGGTLPPTEPDPIEGK